jgi:DNA-binding HxlR family transcriptional regulator
MDRNAKAPHRSSCPLNAVLETLGDSWSLLIVRDLMFKGRTSYQDFHGAEEGIATNILSDRLRRLEQGGIVERRQDPQDARRFIYGLTAKGINLAPVLVEMILWGARHYETAASPSVIRQMTKDRPRFLKQLQESLSRSLHAADNPPGPPASGTTRGLRARRSR